MAGASIDAIGVINQIKDNLTDRYDNGFPVLKEIIQNADDAGATSLKVGWSKGFENADNELLKAPAIFFINDAPLEEPHKEAILSIAQSSKAASKSSVGKFGLGMKSLFHLGEAFFFQSNEWRNKKWAAEVFNPWDRYREKWNKFKLSDKEQIQERVSSLLKFDKDAWFIVWVPLRTQQLVDAYKGKMIISNVNDGEQLPDFFEEAHLVDKTSEILPQLKNLTDISFYKQNGSEGYQLLTRIELKEESLRSHFNGEKVLENGRSNALFSGSTIATVEDSHHNVEYLGYEVILDDNNLSRLKTEEMGWPKSYQFDKHVDEPVEALDKAEQHCAVTVSRVKVKGQAYLRANWAVFLPLADTDELSSVAIEGDYSYNIYLHGYFFVDAGRKGLHGHNSLGNPVSLENVQNDEKRLREAWNVILASEGTFNLVLKAVEQFTKQYRLSSSQIALLTSGLKTILAKTNYLHEITKKYHWLYRVGTEECRWSLLPSTQYCLPLPQPNSGDYVRVWATLPKLRELQNEYCLFESNNKEFISHQQHKHCWTLAQLKTVLQLDIEQVFEQSVNIEYLYQFVVQVVESTHLVDLDELLISLYSKVLSTVELGQLSNNRKLITNLFSLVSCRSRIALPIDKEDGDVWSLVDAVSQQTLLIPKFLESGQKPSTAKLDKSELVRLLRNVDGYLRVNETTIDLHTSKVCEKLIKFVIDAVKADVEINLAQFYQECADFKLFEVSVINSAFKKRYLSLFELRDLLEKHQLFKRSGEQSFGLGFGNYLAKVVPDTELAFISASNAELAFPEGEVKRCSDSASLATLSHYPALGTFEARLNLVSKLTSEFKTDVEKRGFRYLVHGSTDDDLTQTLWKTDRSTKDIWMQLWLQCQPDGFPLWVQIDSEMSDRLNPHYERFLKIEEQSYRGVINRYSDRLPALDYSGLNDEQISDVLIDVASVNDKTLWCQLPLHATVNGQRVAITDNCLMEGATEVPDEWDVQLIKQSDVGEVAAKQQLWLRQGSPADLLNIALSQVHFEHYDSLILQLLVAVREDQAGWTDTLNEKLKKTKWVPNQQGVLLAPEQLVHIGKTDYPEAYALCQSPSSNIYTINQLKKGWISSPEQKQAFSSLIIKDKDAVASKLLSEAGLNPQYALGEITHINVDLVNQFSNLPEVMELFPGWKLVYELYQNGFLDLSLNKQSMLAQPLEPDFVRMALAKIAQMGRNHDVRLVRCAFLEALCRAEGGSDLLPSVKLKNLSGEYVDSRSLVASVGQVHPGNLIDPEEYLVIQPFCSNVLCGSIQESQSKQVSINGHVHNRKVLESYFKPWEGRVHPDAIAFFLVLFSGNESIKELCEGYCRNTTFDSMVEDYSRKWFPFSRDLGPFSGYKFPTLIKSVKFELVSCEANTSYMNSIFGERIAISLITNPDSLLVHQKSLEKVKRIELREVDAANTEREKLIGLLANSIELIFADIFGVAIRFGVEFKKKFGSSEQVDIQVTKKLVLEKLVPMLERLRVREEGLDELLQAYTLETRASLLSNSEQQDRSKINKIQEKIQSCVDGSERIQSLILGAVRDEIGKNFQYSANSVPFELFQNADDAVSELIVMNGSNYEPIRRFDVQHSDNEAVSFFHWGRELNYCRSGYIAGRGRFDRDLEKMVSLNVSDKAEGTTGKFGLGFKSSLLVTDCPQIVSGDICVSVNAGILPHVPATKKQQFLKGEAQSLAIEGVVPTMVRLPVSSELKVDIKSVLSNFKVNAGLLTVFAKNIREINVAGERFTWQGEQCELIPELSFGSVKLPQVAKDEDITLLRNQKIACISTPSGQFVFAVSGRGIKSLAERKKLNSFWVLNPLNEELHLGFVLNANFAVDIGRSQLANDNNQNESLMANLGEELAMVLTKLYKWSTDDWAGFAHTWGLDEQCTKVQFWQSVWDVLTKEWPKHLSGGNSRAHLLRHMFDVNNGVLDFYRKVKALPCGLLRAEPRLISLQNSKYGVSRLLSAAYKGLSHHARLAELYQSEQLLDSDIHRTLEAILASSSSPYFKELDFIQLFEMDFESDCVSAQDASIYGRFFGTNFEKKMESYNATLPEKRKMEESLSKLRFENRRNGFVPADSLVVVKGRNKNDREENLLYTFAPDTAIPHDKYDDSSHDFIRFIRKEFKPALHDWAKCIPKPDRMKGGKQEALCRYMIEGVRATSLINKLQMDSPTWLNPRMFDTKLVTECWGWGISDFSKLYDLWLETSEDKAQRMRKVVKDNIHITAPTEQALKMVFDWWTDNKSNEIKEYEDQLYVQPLPWQKMADDVELEDIETRKGWLKLFFLGSCQTLGRSTDAHHRNVINWFENKRWWNKLAEKGNLNDGRWVELMDEYLETAEVNEKYRAWMQVLPLYRFASKLDEYVHIFMGSGHIERLDDILQPGSSDLLTGSGIRVSELKGTLGIGVNFILRELIRNDVLELPEAESVYKYAYVLPLRIRRILIKLGCNLDVNASPYNSEIFHDFLVENLGNDLAHFELSFDIPFRILEQTPSLFRQCLGFELDPEEVLD